ncbi:MAG TPA: type II secretion system protein [Pyrinomonadaceae bacterium]|nr:type II secretion system protein [Pyrinomonadaceae bacterium]
MFVFAIQNADKKRGDWRSAVKSTGRRVPLRAMRQSGFSLIELVITITVLSILTLGVLPLVKVAVRRQKEQQLRETLRQIRMAIDEFHRDTVGMVCLGAGINQQQLQQQQQQQGNVFIDPRSKVVISDCTIFGVDNPDHYPPDIQTLVDGVNVVPRGSAGGRGQPGVNATDVGGELSTKQKVYLRGLPIDPITGKADWEFRSSYDPPDSGSWGGENVFDVRSKSKATALNGEKYSDW